MTMFFRKAGRAGLMAFRYANQYRYLLSLPAPPHIGLSLFCQINETHPSALPQLQRSSAAFWGQNITYKV